MPDDDDWFWWCRQCKQQRDRGDDAVICDDVDDCIRTEEWDGCACGYVVCAECRRPLVELHETVRDDVEANGVAANAAQADEQYARPDDGAFARPDDGPYQRAGDDDRFDR